jgi:DNA topoisomerase-1
MAKALIIVESPAKARTISRYLGSDYAVESSIGHIRDLPSTAAEIPARYKKEPWARLGVDVANDFRPLYVIPKGKKKQVDTLKKKIKNADELLLATDEDREGEAIAWHLVEVLNPDCPVRRLVFHEITRPAIEHALAAPRDVDQRLVSAQETRRILDRLVGYEVSPVLWRKVRPKLSAGRVQSVATRLIVAREAARMRFVEAAYAVVEAELRSTDNGGRSFTARLTELAGDRLATSKDFDPDTGGAKSTVRVLDAATAAEVCEALEGRPFEVAEVAEKPFTNRPYPPFMTSTLQQEAGRKLRFNAQRTMRTAQRLYENGYITYMRTDSTTLSGEAIRAARSAVARLYGDEYLPDKARVYRSKSRSAQEAHEAIRPAGERFRTPDSLAKDLDRDELRLYELIWKRTMASQMKDAKGMRSTVKISADAGDHGTALLTASGKVVTFAGFLRAYVEGSDDPRAELADQEKTLPALTAGQRLEAGKIEAAGRTTQPPARYTEASLVKDLEARGIGRPSTYATIIQTIQDRGYVWRKGQALVPTFTAFAVTRLLEQQLPDLVDYDFTARMENELDAIASGDRDPVPWLHDFYYGTESGGRRIMKEGLRSLISEAASAVTPREASRLVIGTGPDGEEIAVRIGRYGAYVQLGETDRRASVPDRTPPDELSLEAALRLLEEAASGGRMLGSDPSTGLPIMLKSGRYGPYLQLGENGAGSDKPKMASLWPSMDPESVTLDDATKLLSYPRELGPHPDSGDPVIATFGRYGPYVTCGSENRSLADYDALEAITLEQAVEVLRQPKRSGRRATASVIADLGTHPDSGDAIQVKTGRYGPYVTDGTVNATVPKGTDPASVTLERAVELLRAREDKLRSQGKDPRAKKKRGRRKK